MAGSQDQSQGLRHENTSPTVELPSHIEEDENRAEDEQRTEKERISVEGGPEHKDASLLESKGSDDAQAGTSVPEALIPIIVVLPEAPYKVNVMVSPLEQVLELRQSIQELPVAFHHSCFHLEHAGTRINDYLQVSDVPGLGPNSEILVVLDAYTEKEARLHLARIRELIGASSDRADSVHGVAAGSSVFDSIHQGEATSEMQNGVPRYQPRRQPQRKQNEPDHSLPKYSFRAPANLEFLLPRDSNPAPKTVKTIALSSWNPPPPYLRHKGHLLYIIVTTNEGEQYQITSHVGGFYVNRSSNSKFDPSPRPAPKNAAAHSLLTLIRALSQSFSSAFTRLQEYTNLRDPLATFHITNAIPAAPWLVSSVASQASAHEADMARSQESYLVSGVDSTDSLRDWNEEFQSARELPREAIQDRVFRERLTSKLFADYTDAAVKGAVLVARGEVTPLNPTEDRDSQIFVYNNVFFSFGADGVGTFTSEGGDEAARVATGKDVMGVRLVNQFDVDGIFTPATVVVDYLGRRIVGQSIVPGIFKQRDPGENQIDYGAVDGKDVVAADDRFVAGFAKLSRAFRVKKHAVWDKDGKRFELEGSVETKGLLGTDGRKYALDLYRVTPIDIAWLEENWEGASEEIKYPHRMTVLRPELVEAYARQKMKEYITAEHAKIQAGLAGQQDIKIPINGSDSGGSYPTTEETAAPAESSKVDTSDFQFGLNPDVFCGQVPQTEAERDQMANDEDEVRRACAYLREKAIPGLLDDLGESELSFPMDGRSLTRMLHKRGINIRYLGCIVSKCCGPKLRALADIGTREMIARAFKHIAGGYVKPLPLPLTSCCIAHLLNCLLGYKFNREPAPELDEDLQALYSLPKPTFAAVTPASLRRDIELQTFKRYRFKLPAGWQDDIQPLQLLREVSLKLGLQLQAKNFLFSANTLASGTVVSSPSPDSIGHGAGEDQKQLSEQSGKRKRKKAHESSLSKGASPGRPAKACCTFGPDDIVNIVPIVKGSAPRSSLAEEALEAGRISLAQNQRRLGQDLLLESLSLHEQIYGVLHPEVARVYHQLALLYFQLEEKEAAIELARKAIIVSERTVGLDSEETVLNYLNLSLFLHQAGDSASALSYAQHALEIWKIMFGANHPDLVTTINNAAVMLQHLKAYHESRLWFEESLRICEAVFGKKTANSATLLFQLAQALALDGEAGAAVNKMRDSYSIFREALGPDDKNTKEAESWLDQLTQSAVAIRKNAKEVQERRIKAGINLSNGHMANAAPGPISGTLAAPRGQSHAVDQRSIDDLLKYIEGSDQKKTPRKNLSRGNPKIRGNA